MINILKILSKSNDKWIKSELEKEISDADNEKVKNLLESIRKEFLEITQAINSIRN